MSSSGLSPVSAAPVSPTAAALRVEIVGAAESELIAMLGAVQDIDVPTPHGQATAAAPANPAQQAVDTAKAAAAGEQASLAPLFADLEQAQSAPNLPSPLKAAIGQVLGLQLPADGPIAPEDVRRAVAQSGLFLETDIALTPPGEPAPPNLKAALLTLQQALPARPPAAETPQPAQQAAPPAPEAVPPPQAPALAAQLAATPPSVEPARTPPALATPTPPGTSQATAGAAPTPEAPASGSAAPSVVRQLIVQAGPPPELGLPSALPGAPAPLDPKGAMLALQQALPPPAEDAPAEPAPRDLKAALLSFQLATAEPALAGTPPPPPQHTAPPARDAALSPQAPAQATLPEHADLAALVEHLRPEVEQALARITLHQLASLPDGASSAWMFEIPIATPQGTAIAQFEVDRDGSGSGAADGVARWRARFSISIEPLGPVHVHLAMTGGKARVSIWAEREDSNRWLRDQGAELSAALPAEVVFRAGTPGGAVPEQGHFLNQTS